jgi:hypothetical protein
MNNTNTSTKSGSHQRYFSKEFIFLAGIVIGATCLVYASHLSPLLYYDDWDLFAYNYYKGMLTWFLPDFVRPLTFAPYRLETELFGMNLTAIMVYRVGLFSITSLLYFVIFEKLRLFPSLLNLATVLILMFTPTDMTRMWIVLDPIMIIFLQIYSLGLIFYVEHKSLIAFIIGLIFGFVSLLYYEIQLGLVLAIPILLFVYYRVNKKQNHWWLAFPFAIGIGYLVFRTLGSFFGAVSFHSSQQITLIYLLRQLQNALVCNFQGWAMPIQMNAIIRNTALLALLITTGIFIYFLISKGINRSLTRQFRRTLVLITAGGFLWLAGYFPFIGYGIPKYIDWFSSRAHNTAIPGMAIILIAVFEFSASIIRGSQKQRQIIATSLAIPFLVIGVLAQISIQRESKILWDDYRAMWTGIFNEVPDIVDGTHVVLVITPEPGKPRYGEREFITSASFNTEVSRALSMFYANNSLEGEFMYKNFELADTPTLHDDGIRNPPSYSGAIPYSEILFIEFDRVSKNVHEVEDLMSDLGIPDTNYDAGKHILPIPPSEPTMRYIFSQSYKPEPLPGNNFSS